MDDKESAGIHIIRNIVDKLWAETKVQKIVAGIQQIIALWKYLPDDLKRKSFFVFEKLWAKKLLFFSTRKEIPEIFLQNDLFKDQQLRKIYENLTDHDASALLMGMAMKEHINRAQHSDSEKIKKMASSRYSQRGLTITNLMTTNDIGLIAEEIAEINDKTQIKKVFDFWVSNYQNISVLVSPEEIENCDMIQKNVLRATRSLIRPFVIVNMCSNDIETVNKLIILIEKMKTDKIIDYKEFAKDTGQSGFYFYFKGLIKFK